MAFPTGWTSRKLVVPQAKSGSTDKTNFPVLIKDSALPSEVYAGLQGGEIVDSYLIDQALANYRFESGALTTDSSGNGHTLTNTSVTLGTGKYGGGGVYNGSTSKSDTGINLSGQNRTIAFWFKSDVANDTSVILFGSQGPTDTNRFYIGFDTSNGYLGIGLGANGWANESGGIKLDTNWHHYALAYNLSETKAYLYYDGHLVGTKTLSGSESTTDYYIGANNYHGGTANFVDGTFDDVFIDDTFLSAGEIKNLARGGGADLRFTTDAAGINEIPFDIISLDTAAETCKIYALLPTLYGSSDSDFYAWYGNAAATPYEQSDVYGSQNVWQNYMAVYPTDNLIDRTANGNNASSNTLVSTSASTMVGKGLEGDGSKYAVIPDHISLNYTQLTVQAIVNTDTTAEKGFVSKGLHGSSTMEFNLRMTSTGRFAFGIDNNGTWGPALDAVDSVTPSTGTRYLLHGRYDGTAAKLFKNGSLAATASGSITPTNSSGAIYIGTFFDTSYLMDARVSEIRLRAGSLSDDWIATEQTMFSDPETFVVPITSNILTVNSVNLANIKSINSIAIENVKNVNGVA